ncbi:hypothetical protein Neosp_013120 [[Neocosmospora] mangrovei]
MEDPVEEPSSPESTFPMEQNAMQREVTRLASESNSIRLLRLKGVWGTLSSPNSWKDLEVEKTQWMLSALYNMDQPADEEDRPDTAQDMNSDKPKKVLALYETPGRITSTQFSAVPLDEQQLTPAENSHPSEDTIKQELRNIVGRMLWMEVWGEYITVDTWWWEDPEIIEECVRLQTTWEWRLITACKDG